MLVGEGDQTRQVRMVFGEITVGQLDQRLFPFQFQGTFGRKILAGNSRIDGMSSLDFISHGGKLSTASACGDGRLTLTCGLDGSLRLWLVQDSHAPRQVGVTMKQPAAAERAAVSPGGQWVATADSLGIVRIWEHPREPTLLSAAKVDVYDSLAAISDDGQHICLAAPNPGQDRLAIRIHDVPQLRIADSEMALSGSVHAVRFGKTPLLVVLAGNEIRQQEPQPFPGGPSIIQSERRQKPGWIVGRNWLTGETVIPPIPTTVEPIFVDLSPTRSRAAVLCANGDLLLIDLERGKIAARDSHAGNLDFAHKPHSGVLYAGTDHALLT